MKKRLYGALLMKRVVVAAVSLQPAASVWGTIAGNVRRWLGGRAQLGNFPAESFRSGRIEERYLSTHAGQLSWTKGEPAASNWCSVLCRGRFIEQNVCVS